MTNIKKLAVLGAVVLTIGATSITAFAASAFTPAEIAANVTGKTIEEVTAEKFQNGTTYGGVARNYDSLEKFQAAMLESKTAILNERVTEGAMTQGEADEIIEALKENQATCDGTAQARTGQSFGATFGGMMGNGQGQGLGSNGQGRGQGGSRLGNGLGLKDGSCLVQ